jgi:lambda family phage portal protein
VKGALRGISGGLGVNYNSLANDLESVNYSSMRAGKLEEVEEYKNVQAWLVECLHTPIFDAWLESSLLAGALRSGTGAALPVSKYDKFNAPDWKPRRWPWVDPLKDAQASVLAIEKGLKSRRQIIAESGDDIEAVFEEMAEDQKLADKHGLKFPTLADTQAGKAKEMGEEQEQEQEEEQEDGKDVDSKE